MRGIHVSMLLSVERLVGSQELTKLLGVNRARVYQLSSSKDFPDPVAVLAMGKIWTYRSIQDWADKRGRDFNARALDPTGQGTESATP